MSKRLVASVLLVCAWSGVARAQPDVVAENPGPVEPAAPNEVVVHEPSGLPAAPVADGPVETLSQSELDALGLDVAGPRVDTSFHFWGFADFSSAQLIKSRGAAALIQGRHESLYIGNLNLYFSKNLSESFRTMGEVRLTYLPNGSSAIGPSGFSVQNTSTLDYANAQMVTRWGGIILQRIYLEWTLHRFMTVRAGQFLTPYGIWNVDHGSPTYIPVQRPLAVVSGLYPERQTGFEIFGRWSPTNDSTLGYHLTLSNGTGPISEYKDLDRNKAVGGRLYWEYFGEPYFRIGTSGYYGRDTDSTPNAVLMPTALDIQDKINSQADKLALAADVLFKYKGIQLQSEWMTMQTRYTKAGRVVHTLYGAPVSAAVSADSLSWAGYALAAYRFGWHSIMPFGTVQAANLMQVSAALPDSKLGEVGGSVGISIKPIDDVVVKAEYYHIKISKAAPIVRSTVNSMMFQVAWAF